MKGGLHAFLSPRSVHWAGPVVAAGPQVSTGPWCLVSLRFRTVGSYWVELRKEEALGWEAWSGVLGGAGSQQAWP